MNVVCMHMIHIHVCMYVCTLGTGYTKRSGTCMHTRTVCDLFGALDVETTLDVE